MHIFLKRSTTIKKYVWRLNLLSYKLWWIIIHGEKLFFIKAKKCNVMVASFHLCSILKGTLLSLSYRKSRKIFLRKEKRQTFFLLKVNFQLYSILLLLESIYFAFYKFLQQWVYSFKGNCAWKLTRPTHLHQQINMYWDL